MTIAQYLHVVRGQWLTVALLTVLGSAAAWAWTAHQTPTYTARTQLFVSVHPVGTDSSDDQTDSNQADSNRADSNRADSNRADIAQLSQGSTFVQQRVTSYAAIVTSPEVLDPVIRDLRPPVDAAALTSRVSVQNPADTVVLDIAVTDPDPIRAAAVANGIAAQFPRFVNEIETPQETDRSPVTITPTMTAIAPDSPTTPRGRLNLALGLLVGLGLGVGVAILRDQFDTALSSVEDVEKATGAIPLGVVPYDSTAGRRPLLDLDRHCARAEAFRTLRTNLRFADVDDPPRVIVVTSPLPEEGKSTTACNLALTLSMNGARVILLDGDLRRPSVGTYLGLSNAIGLTNVLAGQQDLRDVVVEHGRSGPGRPALSVLPAGPTPPNPSELLGSQQMADLLTALAQHYDAVVVDAPPLLPVTDATVLAALADGAILVLRHGRTRREDAVRAVQALTAVGARLLGSVLNFAPRARNGEPDGYGSGHQPDLLDLTVPAAVPGGAQGRVQDKAQERVQDKAQERAHNRTGTRID